MIVLKALLSIYVAIQIAIVWLMSPPFVVAYVIDAIVTLGAVWIYWALWRSEAFR